MGRVYVCNGAQMQCTMGTSPAGLIVLLDRKVLLDGQPQANIMDYKPIINIPSFGMCTSLANPVVSAATAAHFGVLTPMPCVPNTTSPWQGGKTEFEIEGDESAALCQDCKLQCVYAGVISLVDSGQGHGQGAFPISKQEIDELDPTTNTVDEKYRIVLKDAYWEKDGMKIRLLPHQKKVRLYVVFDFEPDEDGKSKKNAKFILKLSIPRDMDVHNNEMIMMTIRGSKLLNCEKTEEGYYKYPIDDFSSDLSGIDGTVVREI